MFITRNDNSKEDSFDPTKEFKKIVDYFQEWRGQHFRRTSGPLYHAIPYDRPNIAIVIEGIDWVHMAAITFACDMAC